MTTLICLLIAVVHRNTVYTEQHIPVVTGPTQTPFCLQRFTYNTPKIECMTAQKMIQPITLPISTISQAFPQRVPTNRYLLDWIV